MAALFVLLLAVGAVLWPAGRQTTLQGVFLVFDPMGDEARVDGLYRPLAEYLENISGHAMEMKVVQESGAFLAATAGGADFIFCPDGLAFQVESKKYEPLASGRRAAPRNLRPSSVLVYRKSAGLVERPWLTHPKRTVAGDSLSLAATGAFLVGPGGLAPGCSWGPDPYDHGPVLHAARLGAFDFACVRQWDADRFFSSGLLSDADWGMATLTDPVPDVVFLASRRVPGSIRLEVREALVGVARSGEPFTPEGAALAKGLPLLRLVGFNLLIESDFERVRRNFIGHWQAVAD